MQHKQIVRSWLSMVTSGKIREAYEQFIAPDFRHHNIYFPADAASLMAGMIENDVNFPAKEFEVKKIVEEGDTVITFSRLLMGGGMPEMSVVHIFRFANDRIVELWDVGQQLPEDSPNREGAF